VTRQTIDAIYEGGVFKPLGTPDVPDGEKVRLVLETPEDDGSEDPILKVAGCLSGPPLTGGEAERALYGEAGRNAARAAVNAVLSERYGGGEADVAARHNEHQP